MQAYDNESDWRVVAETLYIKASMARLIIIRYKNGESLEESLERRREKSMKLTEEIVEQIVVW